VVLEEEKILIDLVKVGLYPEEACDLTLKCRMKTKRRKWT
jgi:hypothetical protein